MLPRPPFQRMSSSAVPSSSPNAWCDCDSCGVCVRGHTRAQVAIAERYAQQRKAASGEGKDAGDANSFGNILQNAGIVNPVTKQGAGSSRACIVSLHLLAVDQSPLFLPSLLALVLVSFREPVLDAGNLYHEELARQIAHFLRYAPFANIASAHAPAVPIRSTAPVGDTGWMGCV